MDKVLVGTSDIRIEDPSEARCTQEEIDYFLTMIEKVFPQIKVAASDIVFTFSGVRPLPSSASSLTGQISRDHKIDAIEPGGQIHFPILCLIGGKWTSFRAFSEEVTNVVLERLGLERLVTTEHLAIGGGKGYPRDENAREALLTARGEETALPRQRLITLFERYGTRFKEVASFIDAGRDEVLSQHADYSQREIAFLVREEKIVHLDDLVLRRSLIAMLGELTPELLDELAQIVGESLGWSDEEVLAEVQRTAAILQDKHAVSLGKTRSTP
jgi:glycerol-3-phosphate dehydrogenase